MSEMEEMENITPRLSVEDFHRKQSNAKKTEFLDFGEKVNV